MDNSKVAFRDYLQLEKKYSLHTVNAYLQDVGLFEAYVYTAFEQDDLCEVHYSQIRGWIVSLVDDGISNASINRKIASLKAYYKFLLKIKQVQVSPLLQHKSLKTPKLLQIPFSENELKRVFDAIEYGDDFEGVRDRLIIDLFYTTGIRRSELIGIKMGNVDFSNSTLKVLGKRNKERIVPLLPIVLKAFELYLSKRVRLESIVDGEYFFLTSKGVKLGESLVYRLINKYFSVVSEKVKRSPHVLRHTFATHLLNNGANLNSVKDLLGHASLASTQIYTHTTLSELKKVCFESHPRNNNNN
jgi:integrase/recombinase XerC